MDQLSLKDLLEAILDRDWAGALPVAQTDLLYVHPILNWSDRNLMTCWIREFDMHHLPAFDILNIAIKPIKTEPKVFIL